MAGILTVTGATPWLVYVVFAHPARIAADFAGHYSILSRFSAVHAPLSLVGGCRPTASLHSGTGEIRVGNLVKTDLINYLQGFGESHRTPSPHACVALEAKAMLSLLVFRTLVGQSVPHLEGEFSFCNVKVELVSSPFNSPAVLNVVLRDGSCFLMSGDI